MFNLEQAITQWKQQMMVGGIKNPAVLDELESHLREEIERQMRAGVTEDRAFAVAAQRIGPANALKTEFRRNGFAPVLEKLMIAAAVLVAVFGIFLTSAAMILCYGAWEERLVGFAALGFILLVVFGWSRIVPRLPVILEKRKRLPVELACFFGGCGIATLYFQLIVHHFERHDGVIPAIGFFCLVPVAMGFSLGSAIEQAARRSMTQTSV